MATTPREIIEQTIRFEGPERLPRDFPPRFGSDFAGMGMFPHPDARPFGGVGVDSWGSVWENAGVSDVGEVKEFPLADWADWDDLAIPDVRDPRRFEYLAQSRKQAGDRFILAHGVSLYERVHFIRGLENTWIDIHESPRELGRLIDVLVDMNLVAIEKYAAAGANGLMWCDDWGLQDRLMISPGKWREIWKPRYARVYAAAHRAGLLNFLHSCGHIVAILDDLIEIGLDVIQMDQQENMGLELLGERFGGRLTFYSPVDIQQTMVKGTLDEIRAYCRTMVDLLGRPNGGFIPCWYSDPEGAGHRPEAIEAMCDEFLRISEERQSIS